ncbi:MAG: OB-fold domain-containing protein [Acidimicrobiales bacterium]
MTPATTSGKTRVPAVEGWFTMDEVAPTLLGSRCTTCGLVSFPKQTYFCRNPLCQGTEFAEVELSRTGTVWSFTDACYQPPEPYRAADPYVPFAIAAVELAAEKMVVMGQVVTGVGVGDLTVGTEVELVLDTLYEDDEHEYLVWKWRPVGVRGGAGDGRSGAEKEPAGA